MVIRKEVNGMLAQLWAQQILLSKKTLSQVPRLLKDDVKEILIDSGKAGLEGECNNEG